VRNLRRALPLLLIGLLAALAGCSACTQERSRPFQLRAVIPEQEGALEAALYQTARARLLPGHRVDVLHDGQVFEALGEEIASARRSVNLVVFIWRAGKASDRVLAALQASAEGGRSCRVLVDPVGSPGFERALKPQLEAVGCRAHLFRPLPADENLARNHRKIVVVDGQVGITGGFGIHDPWTGNGDSEEEWRDVNVRVRGPAVTQMQQAFAENWQEVTGELLPKEDFPALGEPEEALAQGEAEAAFVASTANPEVTVAERITQLFVQAAQRRLWIAQSYFTPNEPLRELLVARARAGVDVRVIAPGDKNDHPEITLVQRRTYEQLGAAGIALCEYQPSMMHAKTMLVDEDLVLIGSINYDPLSFRFLEEGSLVVRDRATARDLERAFAVDQGRSACQPAPAMPQSTR
jgi:cardiolipin synthase A/B